LFTDIISVNGLIELFVNCAHHVRYILELVLLSFTDVCVE